MRNKCPIDGATCYSADCWDLGHRANCIEQNKKLESGHGIAREEWESRFKQRIAERAVITVDDNLGNIVFAELQSWPTDGYQSDDWLTTLPEEAADEQMSNWTADE